MDNIIKFPKPFKETLTTDPIPTNNVLMGADKKNLKEVVVLGWDKDGIFYFASSEADGPSVLWLLENAKNNLLNNVYGETV